MSSSGKKSFIHFILWPFRSYIRILIVFSIIGLYQYQSFRVDLLAQEQRQLELKKESLLNETNTLKVKIDQLSHINRIEELAKKRFGLTLAGSDFERLVIREYKDNSKEWEAEHDIHIAGIQ